MGPGAAQLSPGGRAAAIELFARGIPVVAVTRAATGPGAPSLYPGPVSPVLLRPRSFDPYEVSILNDERIQILL
jgi:hypothetical protein